MSHQIAHDIESKQRTNDIVAQESVTFEEILVSDQVLSGLKKSGFHKPSPIQLKAIPLGRCGFDLVVQAKSGTGKTCVFSVVALDSINPKSVSTQVIVLAPTREIALQIHDVVSAIGQDIANLSTQVFIGGTLVSDDRQKAKHCHIAIGSPGRIKQLISLGVLLVNNVRLFVLDEADKLIEEGSLQEQINWIYSTLPSNKQMLALSATYPEVLAQFLTKYMRQPTFVRLNPRDPSLLGLKQYYLVVSECKLPHQLYEEKTRHIIELLSSIPYQQALVFSNYHTRAESLCQALNSAGWPSTFISGSMEQWRRTEAINRLKTYKCRILISTDLTSRGIDAQNVDMVINMDIPHEWETYMHRIGRAGRFGGHGTAISLVSPGNEVTRLHAIAAECNASIFPLPKDILSLNLKTQNGNIKPIHQHNGNTDDKVQIANGQAPPVNGSKTLNHDSFNGNHTTESKNIEVTIENEMSFGDGLDSGGKSCNRLTQDDEMMMANNLSTNSEDTISTTSHSTFSDTDHTHSAPHTDYSLSQCPEILSLDEVMKQTSCLSSNLQYLDMDYDELVEDFRRYEDTGELSVETKMVDEIQDQGNELFAPEIDGKTPTSKIGWKTEATEIGCKSPDKPIELSASKINGDILPPHIDCNIEDRKTKNEVLPTEMELPNENSSQVKNPVIADVKLVKNFHQKLSLTSGNSRSHFTNNGQNNELEVTLNSHENGKSILQNSSKFFKNQTRNKDPTQRIKQDSAEASISELSDKSSPKSSKQTYPSVPRISGYNEVKLKSSNDENSTKFNNHNGLNATATQVRTKFNGQFGPQNPSTNTHSVVDSNSNEQNQSRLSLYNSGNYDSSSSDSDNYDASDSASSDNDDSAESEHADFEFHPGFEIPGFPQSQLPTPNQCEHCRQTEEQIYSQNLHKWVYEYARRLCNNIEI